MDETLRMLGREHEADLERDARKWRRAADVRGRQRTPVTATNVDRGQRPYGLARPRVIAFLVRAVSSGG
jgi:hypothetical protein